MPGTGEDRQAHASSLDGTAARGLFDKDTITWTSGTPTGQWEVRQIVVDMGSTAVKTAWAIYHQVYNGSGYDDVPIVQGGSDAGNRPLNARYVAIESKRKMANADRIKVDVDGVTAAMWAKVYAVDSIT